MVFLVGGANSATDYEIDNSLRLDSASSAYLYRDQVDPTNEGTIYTISVWNKICFPNGQNAMLLEGGDTDGSGATVDETFFMHNASGTLFFQDALNDSTVLGKQTASLQRDVSAWYHFMLSVDTTQGTDTDRLKVYINNTEVSGDMTGGWPVQNVVHQLNKETSGANQLAHWIGRQMRGSNYSDMYIADFAFVDGTQLTPSTFGKTNDNGIWIPKKPSVSAWGDNGWFLEFKQTGTGTAGTTTIGADTSGNNNHFTTSGIAATDITTDTPTNNFATLNPLHQHNSVGVGDVTRGTLSEGNTHFDNGGAVGGSERYYRVYSTIAIPSSGKWYWEVKPTKGTSGLGFRWVMGLSELNAAWANTSFVEWTDGSYSLKGDGHIWYNNNDHADYTDLAVNDIISFKYDADNRDLYFAINGTYENSGNAVLTSTQITTTTEKLIILQIGSDGDVETSVNFGNAPFSISSGNADANGYGNFEYAVPSGYYALCTKNLAKYG